MERATSPGSDSKLAEPSAGGRRAGVSAQTRNQLDLFERVINLVRRHAPGAAIAFNATPSETYEAAARWIDVAE